MKEPGNVGVQGAGRLSILRHMGPDMRVGLEGVAGGGWVPPFC